MKFPRNARIFRGQLDAAPFASMFFVLLIFVLLSSRLYNPGVRVELPVADGLPGTDQPTLAVAVDASGQYFFENQIISKQELQQSLKDAVRQSQQSLWLVVEADKAATHETLLDLGLLASRAGITNLLYATLPRVFSGSSPAYTPGKP